MSEAYLLEPYEFSLLQFAENNKEIFDEYINQRVHGIARLIAFRIAFGEEFVADNNATARVYAVEKNPYFRHNFKRLRDETKVCDLWNPKIAVHHLLSMVVDPFAKDTARLAAMKELNVLTNIVIVDENGKTKAGRSLADFYATEGAQVDANSATVTVAESDLPAESTSETRH